MLEFTTLLNQENPDFDEIPRMFKGLLDGEHIGEKVKKDGAPVKRSIVGIAKLKYDRLLKMEPHLMDQDYWDSNGYNFKLMSQLPADSLPARGDIYLEATSNGLKYTFFDTREVSSTINATMLQEQGLILNADEALTQEWLDSNKSNIVEAVTKSVQSQMRIRVKPSPEQTLKFSHGGGLLYILNGYSLGYPLEHREETGIQVHPKIKTDDLLSQDVYGTAAHYAVTRALPNLDFPIMLSGEIQAQYAVSTMNRAEESGISANMFSILKIHK